MQELPKVRKHGPAPYQVALLHGGPGAPGTMGPLAKVLSEHISVLEPLQTALTLNGLLEELRTVLEDEADAPVALVGSSWGAMFGFIFAAAHPQLVSKLVLMGSGPFEASYADQIKPTRIKRLSAEKQNRARAILASLEEMEPAEMEESLHELNDLFNESDAYDPITFDTGLIGINVDQHLAVWEEARQLRATGELIQLADQIQCKVIAIHGDYDPHPAEGVREPLEERLKNFEFILLENCGHIPLIERQAREPFLKILLQELQ